MEEEENKIEKPQKKHGCLIAFLITIILIPLTCIILYNTCPFLFPNYNKSGHYPGTDSGTGNSGEDPKPQIFTRAATISDITITSDELDLSSFGEKLVFNPNHDINNLEITFKFYKSTNGQTLQTIVKQIGNVTEGRQYSVTLSLTDISWDVVKNIFVAECSFTVTGGTVSYFR